MPQHECRLLWFCAREAGKGEVMPAFEPAELRWRKSSTSDPSECVEVAAWQDFVLVRDSKNRAGPVLEVGLDGWRAFLRAAVSGLGRRSTLD
jgi:Domain of unknown function (DUF397)